MHEEPRHCAVHRCSAVHRSGRAPRTGDGPGHGDGMDTDRLVLRRLALAAGWSDDELARHVRGGDLARLRRSSYVTGTAALTGGASYRPLAFTTKAQLRRDRKSRRLHSRHANMPSAAIW